MAAAIAADLPTTSLCPSHTSRSKDGNGLDERLVEYLSKMLSKLLPLDNLLMLVDLQLLDQLIRKIGTCWHLSPTILR